jgi:probable HAF family extracellular repeat protein
VKSILSMLINATIIGALALGQLHAQQTRYKLIDIGTLGGPSAFGPGNGPGSQLLNNAGVVVGTASTSTWDPDCGCFVAHGFRWQDGVLSDLGALAGGGFSGANAINARGWIVGFSQTSDFDPVAGGPAGHAVLWNGDGMIDLGTLGTGVESEAAYVKNGGQVVGIATVDTSVDPFPSGLGPFGSPSHVFTWKNGVMTDLGTLGGLDSFPAGGCNNQREDLVAGFSFINSSPNPTTGVPTTDPFLWENGKMKDLGTLGGTFSVAQCANNRGQVIGQSSLSGDVGCDPSDPFDTCDEHAFLWDGAKLDDLGTLGGDFSQAIWLNNKGEAVGFANGAGDEKVHATLWRKGAVADLGTLPGDCASVAWAINSRSQTVGQSINCDTDIWEDVLWENGSIFDLGVASTEPLNITDRGEITGVYLPDGCDNSDSCGHAFVLVPCDSAATGGCDNADVTARPNPGPTERIQNPKTQGRPETKDFVALWRARLAKRYRTSSPRALTID